MRIALKRNGSKAVGRPAGRLFAVATGFTLAETMIAGAAVSVIAAALLAALSHSFMVMQVTRDDLRATQITLQKMEAIRLFTWSQVNNPKYLKPMFVEYYDPTGSTNAGGGAVYRGFVSATIPTNVPAAYQTNMRTITVTLYWTNYNGRTPIVHSREMQTHVARNGMQNYVWGNQ